MSVATWGTSQGIFCYLVFTQPLSQKAGEPPSSFLLLTLGDLTKSAEAVAPSLNYQTFVCHQQLHQFVCAPISVSHF